LNLFVNYGQNCFIKSTPAGQSHVWIKSSEPGNLSSQAGAVALGCAEIAFSLTNLAGSFILGIYFSYPGANPTTSEFTTTTQALY
jgi:hypothetical protein